MKLLITVPTETLVDADASAVVAETTSGSFCLLPRHLDMAAPLVPGLLLYRDADGAEHAVAVDEGVMVKVGSEVRVACRRAVVAGDLGTARATVAEAFHQQGEREARARTALAQLELDIVRRLGEMGRRRA